ncbi:hypothetical protein G3O08_08715 [Cryomorpha ignava]|uniref:Dockerin domain-containing protein n=1 Tax=Cryomorpha ignava TaxID=101383 RepID=A0A7K3WRB0_9FLAO|nr:dockerin type I domain-containing protein [Cryomorpha ignava]NEN23581.1 hypothetical protein [Cryomorpha ignava]
MARPILLLVFILGFLSSQAQGPYPLVDVLGAPNVVNVNLGDDFTIIIQLDAQDAFVTVADIFMTFDPAKVQVNNTAYASGSSLNIQTFPPELDNVNGNWGRGGFGFSPATTLFDQLIIECTAIGGGNSLMEHVTIGVKRTLLAYGGEDVTGTTEPIQINITGYDCPALSVNNGDPCQIGSDIGEYVNCDCEVYDCAGVPDGTATLDDCGVCDSDPANDNTTCLDCAGVVNGTATLDDCGVCDSDPANDNTTCLDCAGVINGTSTLDDCGVCDSDPANDNTTCLDCAGVINGTSTLDDCGVCDSDPANDNTTCLDCAGVINGTSTLDDCGVCDSDPVNDNTTCLDCAGVVNGTASIDDCGVCSGGDTGVIPDQSCTDCEGVVNGGALPGTPCDIEGIAGVYGSDCSCLTLPVGNIDGSVDWNVDCGSRSITIEIYGVDEPHLNETFYTMIDANGNFTSPDFLTGTYNVLIKVEGYLAKMLPAQVISSGVNTIDFGHIIAGDLNESNSVNVFDVSTMSAAFGSTESSPSFNFIADYNCDGSINVIDVSILNSGFGMVGDTVNP